MSLHPSEPGVRLNVGVSKSGKTHNMRAELAVAVQHMPIIVFDQTRADFLRTPVPSHRCSTLETAVRLVEMHEKVRKRGQPHAFVVYQPRGDLFTDGAALCAWAVREGSPLVGLAFPEAHLVFPVERRGLTPEMLRMLTAYRHFNVAAWFDTQRVALLNTTIRGQATQVRVFTISAAADLDAIAESVRDRKLFYAAIELCAAHYDKGEYGYHVTLGASRRPPYNVER